MPFAKSAKATPASLCALAAALVDMRPVATKWYPCPDIDIPFGSLNYTFEGENLSVVLLGKKNLRLNFNGVVAVRFEEECPGLDPLPKNLPRLNAEWTFPLLHIQGSDWLSQFGSIYQGRSHFALVTSDHLLQVICKPDVLGCWE